MEVSRAMLLFAAALLSYVAASSAAKCSMHGFCDSKNKLPCIYNGVPKPVTDESARTIMKEACGDYFAIHGDSLCCDAAQIKELAKQVKALEGLGLRRCEACYANFQKLLCNMACSPHQGDWLRVFHYDEEPHEVAEQAAFYVDYKTLRNLYGSCINAKKFLRFVPLSFAYCGQDYHNCTMNLWYGALGKRRAGLTSLDVTYEPVDQEAIFTGLREYRPFQDSMYGCNETVSGKTCSCEDCEAVCEDADDAVKPVPLST
ncbi:NPC intracellular cholesterol transporter 1-like [Amblyomma americanum]|uniref:Niemann-Pick C1 N-terminal domain-containing protein n=1 Tax=Amblyomma americanum TaxID=6943 RepID=A0AAQ4ERL5_AMBAM